MIRRSFALLAAMSVVSFAGAAPSYAQESRPSAEYPDELNQYLPDQLDNLVSSVALYPDALLAQVLVAATFPEQLVDASSYVRSNGTDGIDDQSWDVSVKAVAHYPSVLNMLAEKLDWTTALGRAYAVQSSDVMLAVQRMRAMADRQGNLPSTSQQTVTRDDGNYVISPTQTRIIYVPVYDPYVIYTRPVYRSGYYSPFWSFGVGFPIGGWLSYDCNWRTRAVYYNGWDAGYYGYAGGWRGRSRPYIEVTNIYVNPRYRNVYVNRDVIRRRIEYRNVDRYPGIHRETRFGSRDIDYRDGRDRGVRYPPDRNRVAPAYTPAGGRGDWRDSRGSYGGYSGTNDRRNDRGTIGGYGTERGNDRTNDRSTIGGYGRSSDRGQIGAPDRENDRGSIGGFGRRDDRGQIGAPDRSNDRGTIGNASDRSNDRGSIGGYGRSNDRGQIGAPDRGNDRAQGGGYGGGYAGDRANDRGTIGGDNGNRGGMRDNGGMRGGNPGGDVRGPQRNDAPLINPRREERPAQPQQADRGQGGSGRGQGNRGNAGGRPFF